MTNKNVICNNRTECSRGCDHGDPHEPHPVSFHDAGWGMRSGDLTAVALCRKHHDQAHNGKYGRDDFADEIIMNMKTWIEKGGVL